MTNPVDHSEWIDRYLRGELRGEELDVFERKLKQDPQFALEFNTQKLLADGIKLARKEELKKYIAERTRQRVITLPRNRSFLIGIAASVALFAAGWLGWKSVLPKVETGVAASENPAPGTNAPETRTSTFPPQSNAQKDHTLTQERQDVAAVEPPIVMEENMEDVPVNEEIAAGISDDAMEPVQPSIPAPELVASVRVALAEWESDQIASEAELNESVTVAKAAPRKAITKTQANQEKTAAATAPASRSVERNGNAAQTPYDLVFLNIPEPGTAYEMKSTQQIQLFNIPYLNPLLIRYKGRHFLRSAGTWYELSIPSKGKLPLNPLKDKALLNEFGSE
jgi:hypothetical protein